KKGKKECRDDNKRTRSGNVFAATVNPVGRENTGVWPKGVPRNVNPVNARNSPVRACYECGSTDHIKLIPGAVPIAKSLYCLSPSELEDLS
nr:hypothetical protein [Tanacetum cinerariifolium]